tara:strand:+ start:297 stop:569 length:273 start_codon:yes stop_codon:yes gene_type:complete
LTEKLIHTTDYKKKRDKLYFIDSDGDLCEAVMCGIIDRDENGKPIYASPDKVLELGIKREKGYLYFIKEGKNKICEVWRKKMTKTELKGE